MSGDRAFYGKAIPLVVVTPSAVICARQIQGYNYPVKNTITPCEN